MGSRTHCLAAQTLLATTNMWLEKYRGNYIQPLSKSVTWHMWLGNKTANGGWLLRQSRLSHYVLPLCSHACHSNTRDELLSHMQRAAYVPVCSRLAFEYMFCRTGTEGANFGPKRTCRLANKDKQELLGWTGNILNTLVFSSLSVPGWWLLPFASLLFSSRSVREQAVGCAHLRGQNPSCS